MYRLMIVDDEPLALAVLQNILPWEELNFHICAACSGKQEAYQSLITLHPDVVITDIRMMDGSGMDLVSTVRAEGISTEFIILSAYRNFDVARQAIDNQVFKYLLKPVSANELRACIVAIQTKLAEKNSEASGIYRYDMDFPDLSLQHNLSLYLSEASPFHHCYTLLTNEDPTNAMDIDRIHLSPLMIRQLGASLLISSPSPALPSKLSKAGLSRLHSNFNSLHQMLDESYCSLEGDFMYSNHEFVGELQYYIGKHYAEDISLASLCQTFYRSNSYICNTFKKYTQTTITDFILHVRISHAKIFLKKNDTTLVSQLTGFHNYSYFCRTFKRLTGITPLSYKRLEESNSS